jgi:hypothetical protein
MHKATSLVFADWPQQGGKLGKVEITRPFQGVLFCLNPTQSLIAILYTSVCYFSIMTRVGLCFQIWGHEFFFSFSYFIKNYSQES